MPWEGTFNNLILNGPPAWPYNLVIINVAQEHEKQQTKGKE